MTKPMLTAAQERALDWLPAAGSWRVADATVADALMSLMSERSPYLQNFVTFPRGKRYVRYRLTPNGVAMFHPETEKEGA